ncbi:MAG: FKBP-type peptidyl-prolyl cis-trans isomerase [Bacteroidota bacterium]
MKNLIITLLVVTLISCGGNDSYTTDAGTLVSYHKKGSATPIDSLYSYFILRYETPAGKILFESTKDTPAPIKLDSNFLKNEGDFFSILGEMKVGDSLSYQMTATDLFVSNFKSRLPDSVAPTDLIKVTASFLEQVSDEAYEQKSLEMQRAMLEERRDQTIAQLDQEQMAIDTKLIDEYLEKEGLEAQKTDAGVRYIIKEEGTGGPLQFGQSVGINYAGRLLTGEYFDTSMEDVAKAQGLYNEARPYQPYPVQIWASSVITGWHDGISYLNMGAKATLYIPSSMGYGPRSQGAVIKANSILVFDVEVLEP